MSNQVVDGQQGPSRTRSREVRIGLVMYGGVSLAVYINGVSQELFRAVRGRGVYRLLKALTDSDIIIDVLSGTSAGGINGIMLAFALCNDKEFGSSAELWRTHGDINLLLRDGGGPPRGMTSLLDSESFYQPKLEEAFQKLWNDPIKAGDDDFSVAPEIDLFVTGTDFHGRVYDRFDDLGHAIKVRDHRVQFWLKHRAGRKEPFHLWADARGGTERVDVQERLTRHAANVEALAKMARVTSCFPAAFAPVTVESGPQASPADQRLALWGNLSKPTVLIDGGVLDNKPFTSTLDAIFHRMAERPVSRFLVYVEPDPEGFDPDEASKDASAPNAVRAALDSVTRIPGYESIADDLRSIVEHNNQIERFNQLFAGDPGGPGARLTASSSPASALYLRARLMGLYEAVLHETTGAVPLRGRDGLLADIQVKRLSAWMNGPLGQPEQREEILSELDIEFRLRRLFHLTYRFEGDRALLSVVNAQIQLLEIVRAHLQDTLAAVAAPPIVQGQSAAESTAAIQAFWDTVRKAASASLEKALRYLPLAYRGAGSPSGIVTPLLPHYLRAFADALNADEPVADSERANLVNHLLEGPPRNGGPSFLQLTDAYEESALERCGTQYLDEYLAFEQQIDAVRYPAELVSGMRQKDTIRIVRFSPRDAQRGFSARALESKVSGARLGHFAAFFKKAWRSNDILAGRLDATCQLFETLLDRSRVAEVVNNPDRRQDLRALIGTAQEPGDLGPEKLFPRSPEVDRLRLRAWLQDLTDESAEARQAALNLLGGPGVPMGQKANELLDTLVAAAQMEILPESLEPVLQDAVGEQLAWNVLDTTDAPADAQAASATLSVSPRSGAFVRGRGQFNPTVAMVASGELARRSLGQIKPEQWRGFFLNEYGIGSERVETHIPRIVLLDLFARALLVVRNNLLGALGSRADAVSQHTLFRLFLDWPFRMLAHVAGVLRRSPARQTGFVVGALGHIAISIAVIAIGGKKVVYDSNVGLFLFVIAPVLLIGVLAGVLDRAEQASLRRRIWRGVKVLLALGAGVGGTAALVGLFFQPAGFTSWMTGLISKLPFVGSGSSTAGWLGVVPKVIAVVLPVVAGFFLGRIGRKSPEDRLAAKLLEELKTKVAPERLGSIWYALTQKSRPRLFKLRGPGALVKFARRAHKLDVLERMIAANRNDAVTQLSQPPAAPGATANLPPAPVIDREALRKSLEDLSTEARRRIWTDFTEGERFPFRWWVPSQLMLQRAASDEQLVKLQGLVDRHAPRPLGVSLGAAP